MGQYALPWEGGREGASVVMLPVCCSSKRVQNLAAALAPAYLRFGGTDAEWLIFDPLASRKKKPRKNFTMTGGTLFFVTKLDVANHYLILTVFFIIMI